MTRKPYDCDRVVSAQHPATPETTERPAIDGAEMRRRLIAAGAITPKQPDFCLVLDHEPMAHDRRDKK